MRSKLAAFGALICAGGLGLSTIPASAMDAHAEANEIENAAHIQPNPAYQSEPFEGWGTSLVWFANATGGYPDSVRNELRDAVFGEDGLNLNIARYNIGGGNATDVPPYLRPGGAVQGWWQDTLDVGDDDGSVSSTYEDRERYRKHWSSNDASHYNFEADASQRWWIDAIKNKVTKWEAFSNSPPYFLTESGFVSGGFDSTREQLSTENMPAFADYLVRVVEHLEKSHGIEFDTLDPFNEPNTNYWGTQIDPGTGWPTTASRQEGAHIGPTYQDEMIRVLDSRLANESTSTSVKISAMDETNPGTFVRNWRDWSPEARNLVSQYNVHTYGTTDRLKVRDIAKADQTPLWMSEVEGNWSQTSLGFNQVDIANGLGMAQHIIDDLRELEPRAWVFWQPVEDLYNMEKVEKLNWGSVFVDFDCDENGNSIRRIEDGEPDPSCKVLTNSKFNTIRNFTHHIRPGDRLIPVDEVHSTAAITSDGNGLNIVHVNSSNETRQVAIDLSNFADFSNAVITPITTTESPQDNVTANALRRGTPAKVDASGVTMMTVPARSVTTFEIESVSGISETAPAFHDGESYELFGVQSGKALTAGADETVTIYDPTTDRSTRQAWKATVKSGEGTNRLVINLENSHGQKLALNGDRVIASESADPIDWIISTTTGKDFTLQAAGGIQVLDVIDQSRNDGARVGMYESSGGANQRWLLRDVARKGFIETTVRTKPGLAPSLPEQVTPIFSYGHGLPVNVTWDTEGISWPDHGTVDVLGHGIDQYGNAFDDARVHVVVGATAYADPSSITVYPHISIEEIKKSAPLTTTGTVAGSEKRFEMPVTWDFSSLRPEDLTHEGVTSVYGEAESVGQSVPAILHVIVTSPSAHNVAPHSNSSASFTEPGYSVGATTNMVLDDKAWSNWKSGDKNSTDMLTYELEKSELVSEVGIYTYRDGSYLSYLSRLHVENKDPATDQWKALPEVNVESSDTGAPFVKVDVNRWTQGIRIVLTARPQTHMIISEVVINATRATASSQSGIARLTADGVDVPHFVSGTGESTLAIPRLDRESGNFPEIGAIPLDRDATVTITQASLETPFAVIDVLSADKQSRYQHVVRFEVENPADSAQSLDSSQSTREEATESAASSQEPESTYRIVRTGFPGMAWFIATSIVTGLGICAFLPARKKMASSHLVTPMPD